MTALSAPRMTDTLHGDHAVVRKLRIAIAASVKIWQGAQVMIDGGYLKPVSALSGKRVVGRACATYDNTTGAAGAIDCEVERGTFGWAIGDSADALVQADIGSIVYAIDDQTVGKTDGGAEEIPEVKTLTPTAANTTVYALAILVRREGLAPRLFNFSITSDGSATATEINDAFRTAMAADAAFTALIVATGTATLILTRQEGGSEAGFDVTNIGPGVITVASTTAGSGGRSIAGILWQLENGLAWVENLGLSA